MFLLFPVGIEGHQVRIPIVCLGIVALCALGFLGTWLLPSSTDGVDRAAFRALVDEWEKHPYLEFPKTFTDEYLTPPQRALLAKEREKWLQSHTPPTGAELEEEQQAFEAKFHKAFDRINDVPLRKFSLVPQRGYLQIGLITSMFLHFGWLHLLGNLLFFYMCGPLLEDTWGRRNFAIFYVVGGVLAATAHYLIDRHSAAPMAGASGAIAACMGAFAVRFATRKVSMAYLIFIGFRLIRGVTQWPAWVCGGLWFGSEALTALLTGGKASGVAVMAHVGGFAFGACVAFGMKAIGIEKQFIPSAELDTGPLQASYLKEVEEARALLAEGKPGAARAKLEAGLKGAPEDADAEMGLVMLDFGEGAHAAAVARLEKLLQRLLRQKNELRAISALTEAWPHLKPDEDLKPPLAFALARGAEALGAQGQGLLEVLFLRAGAAQGLMGAKALLRAAELLVERGDVTGAGPVIDRLLARPTDAGPELLAKAQALKAKVPDLTLPEASGLDLMDLPRPPPKVTVSVLTGVTASALRLKAGNGDATELHLGKVLGVAAGVIPVAVEGKPVRGMLVVDLILSWGDPKAPAVSVRLDSDTTAMSKLFAGTTAAEVYGKFFAHVLEASGATPLPDADALKTGKFPRYPSTEARDAAIFPA